ncbi:MAG: ribbon-helix-helix protein, CopG family [Desulfovibrio sp.]|nr:MAG: ribbon-helix-helix protein, CopG family [Desulfovibrio sp.]
MPHYIALIYKDEHSDFGVAFPDFPGIVTAGRSLDEARTMAEEALSLHLETMAEEGLATPEPTSLDAIMADPDNSEAVSFMAVPAPPVKPRVKRVNITLAETTLKKIDAWAEDLGLNRSAYLAEAARHYGETRAAGGRERGKK